jgi:hypothetical protein
MGNLIKYFLPILFVLFACSNDSPVIIKKEMPLFIGQWHHEFYPPGVNSLTGEILIDQIIFTPDSFFWTYYYKINCSYIKMYECGIYSFTQDSIFLNQKIFVKYSISNGTFFLDSIPYILN